MPVNAPLSSPAAAAPSAHTFHSCKRAGWRAAVVGRRAEWLSSVLKRVHSMATVRCSYMQRPDGLPPAMAGTDCHHCSFQKAGAACGLQLLHALGCRHSPAWCHCSVPSLAQQPRQQLNTTAQPTTRAHPSPSVAATHRDECAARADAAIQGRALLGTQPARPGALSRPHSSRRGGHR